MSFSISNSKPRPALFVSTLLALLGVLAVIVWTAQLYFLRTGDLLSEDEAVKIQHSVQAFCPYESRAANNHGAYKLALFKQIKPDVVVIGSSIMLQFAAPMFKGRFANLGRTMNYLNEGPPLLQEMVRMGKPKLAVIGLDFWWFNPNHRPRKGFVLRLERAERNNPAMLKTLVGEVVANPALLMNPGNIFDGVQCPIGVAAKAYLQGFERDGFRYYGGRFTRDPRLLEDYRFMDTQKRIEKGKRKFQRADKPDVDKIEKFIEFVNAIKAAGIEVVLIAPPVAPKVAEMMRKASGYGYIAEAIEQIRSSGFRVHDFHDPSVIDLDDCDFLDGFHAGDAASARMLQAMAGSEAGLSRFLNHEEIERLASLRGRAAVYFHERLQRRESDFLGLGCAKQG